LIYLNGNLMFCVRRDAYLRSIGITPNKHGDTTMLTTSKAALALVLALGTVSAATAMPKHSTHHQRAAVERRAPVNAADGASAYGYATRFRVPEPNAGAGIGTNFLSSGEGTIAN
jgi:hypothetical protein